MPYDPSFFNWTKYDDSGTYVSKEFQFNDISRKFMLPKTPGCYIWKREGQVLYVGYSSNIYNRLGNHLLGKISGPRSNAIYSTTARDTIIRHFHSEIDHEQFRKMSTTQKIDNIEFMEMWANLLDILNDSSFIIFSSKTQFEARNLERCLISEFQPVTNNVVPAIKIRNDREILGI